MTEVVDGGFATEGGWASREVAEMAAAWGRGERVRASEILRRHPEADDEAALRLIFEEALLRREAGLDVDTSEVVREHPRWGDELRAIFRCDRLFRPSGAPDAFPDIGERLGTFLLRAELGRGASGRTYLADDEALAGRPVVLKVIPGDQDEHLTLALLRHTHIVPLFSEHAFPDLGLRGICMPYLGGTSLAEVLDGLADVPPWKRSGRLLIEALDRIGLAPPTPADGPYRRGLEGASYPQAILWVAACLADALDYAHARGLVHMDLKPSNVLIAADGQPMLLDFHLARGPIAARERVVGHFGGTPGWMAPEQRAAMEAVGAGRPSPVAVDGRVDIFAMGLLLRNALGRPAGGPDGESVALADIVSKCLAPDPRDRYGDAATLAEDLRRQLNDLPLRGVRNRSRVERWRKWRRRNPGSLAWLLAGASALLATALALGGSAAAYSQRLGQVKTALEDGRADREAGKPEEAIRTLSRGIDAASTLPGLDGWRGALRRELHLAERSRMARDLHDLADLVRFRYGIDPPPPEEAHSLGRLCRAILGHPDLFDLAAGARAEVPVDGQIATDLREVAAVWADTLDRRADPGVEAEARRLLDRADALAKARPREGPGGSPTAWELYDRGRSSLRAGDYATAAERFARGLELRPQDFWLNFYQGLCAYRLGRFGESADAFRVCIALQPESAECYYNRALAFAALGRVEPALRDYDRALRADPNLVVAALNRGILSYQAGRLDAAEADFRKAIRQARDAATLGKARDNLALVERARAVVPRPPMP